MLCEFIIIIIIMGVAMHCIAMGKNPLLISDSLGPAYQIRFGRHGRTAGSYEQQIKPDGTPTGQMRSTLRSQVRWSVAEKVKTILRKALFIERTGAKSSRQIVNRNKI